MNLDHRSVRPYFSMIMRYKVSGWFANATYDERSRYLVRGRAREHSTVLQHLDVKTNGARTTSDHDHAARSLSRDSLSRLHTLER